MYNTYLTLIVLFIINQNIYLQNRISFISNDTSKYGFSISERKYVSPILLSSYEFKGVIKAANDLKSDINKVTENKVVIFNDEISNQNKVIIIGTIGKSPIINNLISKNKLNVDSIKGKWEAFKFQVVENTLPNVNKALVIVGSDMRGTIYGIYTLSEQIGVSPWNWWADVPIIKNKNLYITQNSYIDKGPKVKYRGIFINDEAPALSGWTSEKFGGFNHKFYVHVYELILRLRGNFLWPAMWGSAFYDDDSLNPKLADEYGVVIGTSHHEPMMRAHDEWRRYGHGPWNYATNEKELKKFWTEGIKRMNDYESIVTLAMRGDGDEAMSEDTNIGLLEKIVKDQREIIKNVTRKDIESVPQVWALYKEVQDYYDKGMRVPDDVTVLLCDDNWGNLRKLPKLNSKQRKGGYGIYYHFDYVGGPRNYKWLNTNQIERVWEQMHLAYKYDAKQIWIVNVGDIKPMEFPISFFLDYAWDPDEISADQLPDYYTNWTKKQFGGKYAKEIGEIIKKYTQYNSRRKPELLSPHTYSLTNYNEANKIVSDYNKLAYKAQDIYDKLSPEYKNAYYQLVLYPVLASANLNDLNVTIGLNRLYAEQGRNETNILAKKARQLFNYDAGLTKYYNTKLADGKWNHMMDQTHIGYTYWQQPDSNTMPKVFTINVDENPRMGVSVENSNSSWPASDTLVLPEFNSLSNQDFYVDIFNKGKLPFDYKIEAHDPYIIINKFNDKVETQKRIYVSIDWTKAPLGKSQSLFTIFGPNQSKSDIYVTANNLESSQIQFSNEFIESNGYISIEAEHYTNTVANSQISWFTVPGLGRTLSAVTPRPVTAEEQTLKIDSPHLEYNTYFFSTGGVKVNAYFSPTLNFENLPDGIRFAVSFDNDKPQIINLTSNPNPPDLNHNPVWNNWVANNINIQTSLHKINEPGRHTLKIWMIDPGIVLQKIVIDAGGKKECYLGPPESYFVK